VAENVFRQEFNAYIRDRFLAGGLTAATPLNDPRLQRCAEWRAESRGIKLAAN